MRLAALTGATVLGLAAASVEVFAATPADWHRVEAIPLGATIELTCGPEAVIGNFLYADATMLVVRITANQAEAPPAVDDVLLGIGELWPGVFAGVRSINRKGVRVSLDGIAFGERYNVPLQSAVRQVSRDGLLRVKRLGVRRHSVAAAVLGGAAAFGGAIAIGRQVCGMTCNEGGAVLLIFGLPAVGAVVGYHASARLRDEIVYEGPEIRPKER